LSFVEGEKNIRPYREGRSHVEHIQGSAADPGCVSQRKPLRGLENFGGKGKYGIDAQNKVSLECAIRRVYLSAGQLFTENA
jgi:hypothetical protein